MFRKREVYLDYSGVIMETITKTTPINTTQEALFEFHLDSNNIAKITPKNTKVELLNDDGNAFEGKIVKLKTSKFFIPTYWEVKIEKLQKPEILVDIAIKSPFKYWKHQHIFKQKGSVCELEDRVEYQLPFGIFGKIVAPFIKKDIINMFDYRHTQTKQILENKAASQH